MDRADPYLASTRAGLCQHRVGDVVTYFVCLQSVSEELRPKEAPLEGVLLAPHLSFGTYRGNEQPPRQLRVCPGAALGSAG